MEPNQIVEQPTSIPPTPPQPAVVPTPVMTPQPNTSKLPMIILILVSLVSLSGLVYFYLQTQSLKQQVALQPTPTPSASDTPKVQPSPTADPTAKWKNYTNSKYGFSFKYPTDLSLTEGSNTTQEIIVRLLKNNDTLELFIQPNNDDLPLDEYIQKFGGDYPSKSAYKGTLSKNYSMGTLTGEYIIFPQATKSQFDYSGVSQHFYFTRGNKVYWIRLMQTKDNLEQEDKDYFSQIIASFKFIDSQ